MKKLLSTVTILALTAGISMSFAGDKPKKMGSCGACHNNTKDGVGPSFKKVANAYGNAKGIVATFNKGGKYTKADAKVAKFANKYNMMKGQLRKIAKWSDAEKKEAAAYIMKQK